jgi:hypothetical protein
LTGIKEARLDDLQRVTAGSTEGGGSYYVIHFGDGRAWVSGSSGTAFVDALVQAAPHTRVAPPKSWWRLLRRRSDSSDDAGS